MKDHNRFLRVSILAERSHVLNLLTQINASLSQQGYSDIVNQLDGLKTIVRNYKVQGSPESQTAVEERINRLSSKGSKLEESIEKILEIERNAEKSKNQIEKVETAHANFPQKINELNQKYNDLKNLFGQSTEYSERIKQLLASLQSESEVTGEFSKHIEERKTELESQAQSTEEYKQHLESYEQEHKKILGEANKLIGTSRQALEYATAAGISAAYQEKYRQARQWWNFAGWLAGAFVFIVVSIALGFHISVSLTEEGTELITAVLRLTLIPLLIAGAWFCASRYVKNKNLAEDYSYKAVLAKSLVAFMEKIEEKDKSYYVRGILNQILQDPLRKRHDEVDFMKSAVESVAEKKDPNPQE